MFSESLPVLLMPIPAKVRKAFLDLGWRRGVRKVVTSVYLWAMALTASRIIWERLTLIVLAI